MATGYDKSATAAALGISKGELEARAKAAGFSDTESYASSIGKNVGSSGVGGSSSTIQKAIDMQTKAIAPAVNSYKASIPEQAAKFAQQREQIQAEITPLQGRYKNLLDSIKSNQVKAENRQTVTTNNELGRRGILGSSGLAEQTITDAVNPITSEYTTQIKDTGFQQEADLRNLANLISSSYTTETDATRAINNAIAQLQSGAAQTGIGQGYALQGQQAQIDAAKQAADWQKMLYETIQLPQSKADVANTYSQINNRNNEATGITADEFLKSFLGAKGTGATSFPSYFTPDK